MSAIVITGHTPDCSSGRGLRTVGIIRALALLGDVEIDYVPFGAPTPPEVLSEDPSVRLEPIRSSRGPSRAAAYARALVARVPPGYARGISTELVEAAVDARERGADPVVADGPTAAAAAVLLGGQDVVYNAHNLESALRSQLPGARRESRSATRLARFEARLLASAAETWLPSQRDLEGAAALVPSARLRLVPNVVDVDAISPISPAGEHRVLLVGDFTYEPNRRAAGFLVEDVMPQVWARMDDARVALVGRGLDLSPADPRVEVLGFVDDLGTAYAAADCAVVPVLESGGSQLKLVEAMAYGLPVVATPVAGAGLDGAVPGVHYLEAETPDAFAEAIVLALRGEARELAAAARALAEREYSIAALAKVLAA